MEVLTTPAAPRPQRSLSYNDLKKRRLQRSASNKKMTIQAGPNTTHTKRRNLTEQKSIVRNVPRNEKVIQGVIDELKHVLGDIRRKKSDKCFFSLRESMTDRPSAKKTKPEVSERKQQPLWSNVEDGGQTKQFIRLLLNKNKSQRRMMRFNEVRDKFKEEKQKSLSRDKLFKAKQIESPFKDKTVSKQKAVPRSIEKDSNKQTIKNSIKQEKISALEHSLEELTNCPENLKQKIWQQEIQGKQNHERTNIIMDVTEISQIRKNDDPEESNQFNSFFPEKTHMEGSFLRLLEKPIQLESKVLNRQVRRRTEIERIRRIFPLGFFAS